MGFAGMSSLTRYTYVPGLAKVIAPKLAVAGALVLLVTVVVM